MTPADAMKTIKSKQVRLNVNLRRTHVRLYPNINVDDIVRLFKKKETR